MNPPPAVVPLTITTTPSPRDELLGSISKCDCLDELWKLLSQNPSLKNDPDIKFALIKRVKRLERKASGQNSVSPSSPAAAAGAYQFVDQGGEAPPSSPAAAGSYRSDEASSKAADVDACDFDDDGVSSIGSDFSSAADANPPPVSPVSLSVGLKPRSPFSSQQQRQQGPLRRSASTPMGASRAPPNTPHAAPRPSLEDRPPRAISPRDQQYRRPSSSVLTPPSVALPVRASPPQPYYKSSSSTLSLSEVSADLFRRSSSSNFSVSGLSTSSPSSYQQGGSPLLDYSLRTSAQRRASRRTLHWRVRNPSHATGALKLFQSLKKCAHKFLCGQLRRWRRGAGMQDVATIREELGKVLREAERTFENGRMKAVGAATIRARVELRAREHVADAFYSWAKKTVYDVELVREVILAFVGGKVRAAMATWIAFVLKSNKADGARELRNLKKRAGALRMELILGRTAKSLMRRAFSVLLGEVYCQNIFRRIARSATLRAMKFAFDKLSGNAFVSAHLELDTTINVAKELKAKLTTHTDSLKSHAAIQLFMWTYRQAYEKVRRAFCTIVYQTYVFKALRRSLRSSAANFSRRQLSAALSIWRSQAERRHSKSVSASHACVLRRAALRSLCRVLCRCERGRVAASFRKWRDACEWRRRSLGLLSPMIARAKRSEDSQAVARAFREWQSASDKIGARQALRRAKAQLVYRRLQAVLFGTLRVAFQLWLRKIFLVKSELAEKQATKSALRRCVRRVDSLVLRRGFAALKQHLFEEVLVDKEEAARTRSIARFLQHRVAYNRLASMKASFGQWVGLSRRTNNLRSVMTHWMKKSCEAKVRRGFFALQRHSNNVAAKSLDDERKEMVYERKDMADRAKRLFLKLKLTRRYETTMKAALNAWRNFAFGDWYDRSGMLLLRQRVTRMYEMRLRWAFGKWEQHLRKEKLADFTDCRVS